MTLPITLIDRSSYKSLTKKNRLQRKIVNKEKIADKAKITNQEKIADRYKSQAKKKAKVETLAFLMILG